MCDFAIMTYYMSTRPSHHYVLHYGWCLDEIQAMKVWPPTFHSILSSIDHLLFIYLLIEFYSTKIQHYSLWL